MHVHDDQFSVEMSKIEFDVLIAALREYSTNHGPCPKSWCADAVRWQLEMSHTGFLVFEEADRQEHEHLPRAWAA